MTNCQYRYNHLNTPSLSQQLTPIFLLLSMKMIPNQSEKSEKQKPDLRLVLFCC